MFKKLLQLKTLLVALLVMTGAGNVWADEVTYTFTTKSWGATIGNTQANWTSGQDGGQLTQGRGIQVTTSASGANGTSPVSYSNISKIVVKYCTNADKGAGKIKVKVGDGNEQSFTVSKPSSGGTTLKNATFNFSPAETGNVKVTVNCTTNSVYIHSVTITYSSGSTTETCATPTFSPAEGTYTSAQNVTLSTTTDGATIYYTTDGTDPETSSSSYSSAIPVSATTTIKAIAVKEGMDNSDVVSATYTIVSLAHAGTEEDPYTVADARTAIDANVGKTGVYAKGIVSDIVTAYSSEYNNITFDIVDENGTATLRAYRCIGTEAANVQVGDIVVVSGNLTTYNDIYEFAAGNQLISLDRKEAAVLESIALSGTYPTTFVEGSEFGHEGMTVTATYEDESTKDVTASATFEGYDMDTPGNQTVTVSYTEGDVTKTATYEITVNAAPSHNVTWSVNGETIAESSYKEGASISFPANPADVNGKTFVGWVTTPIAGVTDTAPSFVTSATMGTNDVTYYAVFANREGGVSTVKDELNLALTGVTANITTYSEWSNKSSNSSAVYAGNSAGGKSSIQLRTKDSDSGIVTTTSGGTLSKVTVTWNSSTSASRTLNVYGSNTAYGAAADLYNNSKQGTLLGSIVKGTSTELTVSGDYAYVGLRSADGAMYLDQVDITWSVSSNTYSDYCTSVNETPKTTTKLTIDATGITNTDVYVSKSAGALAATVRQKESNELVEGAIVTWTSSNTDVATIAADGTVTLVAAGTTTLTATYAGDETYAGSTNTYELTVTDSEPAPIFAKVTDVSALTPGDVITFVNEEAGVALGKIKTNNYGEVSVTIDNDVFESKNIEMLTLVEGHRGDYVPEGESVWAFKNSNEKYLNAPGGTSDNYMKESSELNTESSAVIRFDADGNATVRFTNYSFNNTSARVIVKYNSTDKLFSCYRSGQKPIQIYKVVTNTPLTVSAAGYATFSSTTALDFTNVVEDIHAYTATVSGDVISFTRVNKVPANTGLLLRSVKGGAVSTSVPSLTDAAEDVTGNAFVAATEDIDHLYTTVGDYTNYILNNGSSGIGFYKANGQKVGAGKAYLHVSSELATRAYIAFSFDDPETDIAQIETLPQQGVAYDLQGRRVNAPKGGLYIINGKKVIVK